MRRSTNHKNHKISKQLTFISVAIMAGSILICCILCAIFLGKYYSIKKMQVLKAAYRELETKENEGDLEDGGCPQEVEIMCLRNNVDLIIVDMDSRTVSFTGMDADSLRKNLWDKIFLDEGPSSAETIIEQNNRYQISISRDKRSNTEYMEMWGSLSQNHLFLFRTPMESIDESARLANHFMIYTGVVVILVSGIVIMVITRRITKPILNLAEISDRVRRLDFNAKYKGNDKNEIGLLGDNINKMSESLEQTISELKAANIELRKDIEKKNKLEEMRSEFVSNISHELKTPIAIIQGYAEGLAEGISDDSESREYYCNVICEETARMNNIVKQLLTLNELESGADAVNMERFDIVCMIKNRMQASELIAQNAGISMSLEGPSSLDVWGDEFKVEEVFTNLFSNAINHCEGNKNIFVKAMTVGDKARISVFNTGEHIPEEALEHIFEKFYKVDKARSRMYGGSGIGLSIVKAIQDSVGQQYGVENVDGGVSFWFELDASPGWEENRTDNENMADSAATM